MPNQHTLENEVISLTRELIHNYYQRDFSAVSEALAEELFWIGPYDFQWAESAQQFRDICSMQCTEEHCVLNREHYRLVTHDAGIWVVAGSFQATAKSECGSITSVKRRLTFVWSHHELEWKLVHMHLSNAASTAREDGSAAREGECSLPEGVASAEALEPRTGDLTGMLSFRTTDRQLETLTPAEVLRIESDHQYCNIYRMDGTGFRVRSSMESLLSRIGDHIVRVHRSHAVNLSCIIECKYKGILLKNGERVPCAKEKVKNVRTRWIESQLDLTAR